MPFTPFHLGPGLALKVCSGKYLSLVVFGFTQILMDVEPLIRLWRDDAILHGLSHTYLGATVIGLVAVLLGRPFGIWALTLWNSRLSTEQHAWLALPCSIFWLAACSGAFLGSYSHVLLDSLMHADMRPWAPFTPTNVLLHSTSHSHLHLWCLILGIGGMVALVLIRLWPRANTSASQAEQVLENQ